MSKYFDNASFYEELVKSFKQDKLTDLAWEIMQQINDKIFIKLKFKSLYDAEFSKEVAENALNEQWRNFDVKHPDKYPNYGFNFFNEVAKRGYAKAWNKLNNLGFYKK